MTSGAARVTRKIGKRFVVESMSAAFPCGGIHHTHHIHHMPTARIADARMGARKRAATQGSSASRNRHHIEVPRSRANHSRNLGCRLLAEVRQESFEELRS